MDAEVTRQTVELERAIGREEKQVLILCETAVPDAGRETVRPLMEEASFALDGVEAQDGRVMIDGTVLCQAAYCQGEGAPRAVSAQTAVSESVEMEGVTPHTMIKAGGTVDDVTAQYDNGRMRFTCTLTLHILASTLDNVELITDVSGMEDMQAQYETLESEKLAAQSGGTALVRQEVALPAALDARTALLDWASARITDIQADLGGVKATGDIQAGVFIGTGVSDRPMALVKVSAPFELTMQMPDWLSGDVDADASVDHLITSVSPGPDGEGAVLTVEAQVSAAARAYAKDSVSVLTDAYGAGKTDVACTHLTRRVATGRQIIDCREPFRGTLLLPEGAPGAGTVLGVRCRPVPSGYTAANGTTRAEGVLEVRALYLTGGSETILSARGELPFEVTCPGEWPNETWITLTASGAEAASLMSDRLEVRCTLEIAGFYRTFGERRFVTEIASSPAPERRSGMVIHWPQPGDTPWSLGRALRLPVDAVTQANGGKPALEAGSPIILML